MIEQQEMYGEFFDIPVPDELVFVSSFSGGEVFRSGCTFRRGHGKIFFFSPGDQDYPVYHHKDVRKVIANGVAWAMTDRPERAVPTLLRYETGDFFNGHGLHRARSRSRRMPDPLRLLQVGAGGMGRAWLRTIADNPDVDLVGLVDLDVDVARAAADEHGFGDVPVATLDRRAGRRTPTRSSTSPCRSRIPRSAWMPCCVGFPCSARSRWPRRSASAWRWSRRRR